MTTAVPRRIEWKRLHRNQHFISSNSRYGEVRWDVPGESVPVRTWFTSSAMMGQTAQSLHEETERWRCSFAQIAAHMLRRIGGRGYRVRPADLAWWLQTKKRELLRVREGSAALYCSFARVCPLRDSSESRVTVTPTGQCEAWGRTRSCTWSAGSSSVEDLRRRLGGSRRISVDPS